MITIIKKNYVPAAKTILFNDFGSNKNNRTDKINVHACTYARTHAHTRVNTIV